MSSSGLIEKLENRKLIYKQTELGRWFGINVKLSDFDNYFGHVGQYSQKIHTEMFKGQQQLQLTVKIIHKNLWVWIFIYTCALLYI